MRYEPETIDEVRTCLDCPDYMKVEVKGDAPVAAKTVADLRSLSTWPHRLGLEPPPARPPLSR